MVLDSGKVRGYLYITMKNPPLLTRAQFEAKVKAGHRFCWASLYERQDYRLDLGNGQVTPVRDITNEPAHWHRTIGRK